MVLFCLECSFTKSRHLDDHDLADAPWPRGLGQWNLDVTNTHIINWSALDPMGRNPILPS